MLSMGVLMRLNIATRRWHAEADDPWLRLLRPDTRREDYRTQLVRMYGFQAPLDSACAYTPKLAKHIESRQLIRAGLIAQDLLALGMPGSEISKLPQTTGIAMFDDELQALGWLYVIERGTLLHDRIRRHLVRTLDVPHASAYLSAFDGHATNTWQRFGNTLEEVAETPDKAAKLVDAAHAGFACLQTWYRDAARAGKRAV